MFTNYKDKKTPWLTIFILLSMLISIFFLPTTYAQQSAQSSDYRSISQEKFKKEAEFSNNKTTTSIADQLSGKATGQTREIMLKSPKSLLKTAKKGASNANQSALSHNYYADFAIYGATSFLLDDIDGDSFYQTFSVTFDADIFSYTSNQLGEVYALLYISKNGGPWTHYYTTDSFIINGDTDLDEYEVVTTFLSGYPTDYYDVLIDLYEVGYTDVVASYSSNDDSALYALPLESADYDEPYIEVVEVHGGSMAMLTLLILGICFIRTTQKRQVS